VMVHSSINDKGYTPMKARRSPRTNSTQTVPNKDVLPGRTMPFVAISRYSGSGTSSFMHFFMADLIQEGVPR